MLFDLGLWLKIMSYYCVMPLEGLSLNYSASSNSGMTDPLNGYHGHFKISESSGSVASRFTVKMKQQQKDTETFLSTQAALSEQTT